MIEGGKLLHLINVLLPAIRGGEKNGIGRESIKRGGGGKRECVGAEIVGKSEMERKRERRRVWG